MKALKKILRLSSLLAIVASIFFTVMSAPALALTE